MMNFQIKHIIHPTDFSKNAEKALLFAAEIASKTGSKITLFHASQDTMDIEPNFEKAKDKNVQDINHRFDELISGLKENSRYEDLSISTILQSGLPATNLLSQINTRKPDLVVMGTKGATGNRNELFGSVTAGIINKSEVPVLAIPNNSSLEQFVKFIFATDFKDGDLFGLSQVIDFAKIFNSEIDVLHIAEAHNMENEIKFRGFRELVNSQTDYDKIDFHLRYELDFFAGAANYLVDNSTSLLVMIRYKKTYWEKLTERNYAREMAFYSNVPLMMLIGKKSKSNGKAIFEHLPAGNEQD